MKRGRSRATRKIPAATIVAACIRAEMGASTIPGARQLVNHRHILVNGRIVDIPSCRCKPRDIITTKDKQRSKALLQKYIDSSPHEELPNHLTIDSFQYKGFVNQITDSKWIKSVAAELIIGDRQTGKTAVDDFSVGPIVA